MEAGKENTCKNNSDCGNLQQDNGNISQVCSTVPVISGIVPQPPPLVITNATLERESLGCANLVFYIFVFIHLDVLNQILTYDMKYINHNLYPVPQTSIVFATEVLKFLCSVAMVTWTSGFRTIAKVQFTLWYSIPSICYAINNNIHYYALNFSTPPVWNILGQLRLVFTALTYRLFFKRTMTTAQWLGLALLLVAVVLANFTGVHSALGRGDTLPVLLCLAALGSSVAVIGSFTTEARYPHTEARKHTHTKLTSKSLFLQTKLQLTQVKNFE